MPDLNGNEFSREELAGVEPTDDPYIYVRKRLASTEKVKIDVRKVRAVEPSSNSRDSCFVKYKDGGYDVPHVEPHRVRRRVEKRKKQLAADKQKSLDEHIDSRVDKRLKEVLGIDSLEGLG